MHTSSHPSPGRRYISRCRLCRSTRPGQGHGARTSLPAGQFLSLRLRRCMRACPNRRQQSVVSSGVVRIAGQRSHRWGDQRLEVDLDLDVRNRTDEGNSLTYLTFRGVGFEARRKVFETVIVDSDGENKQPSGNILPLFTARSLDLPPLATFRPASGPKLLHTLYIPFAY